MTSQVDRTAISDLPPSADVADWREVFKDTAKRAKRVEIADRAAAMTYFGVLAIFPAVIALVSLISLLGDPEETINTLLNLVDQLGPSSAVDQFRGTITRLANRSGGGWVFFVGIALAVWSASGYIGAFGRAVNALYGVPEGRKFLPLRGTQLALTLLGMLTAAVLATALTLSGGVLRAVGDELNAGSTLVTFWKWARWPLVVVLLATFLAVLYHFAPNVRHRRFRLLTRGSLLALTVWAVASVAFGLYVSMFGSYDKTYGSLAGAIIGLVWLWLSNLAFLFGACFDVEIERHRELAAGVAADPDPLLPLRGTKVPD